jgi:hypothetical protein
MWHFDEHAGGSKGWRRPASCVPEQRIGKLAMITRRDFVNATVAAGALSAGMGVPLHRLAAQGRLTQEQLLTFPSAGNVTIVHVTDIHAQLVPQGLRHRCEIRGGPRPHFR